MPVLSNNGRLISSLPVTSTLLGQDELLLQSNGVTKRVSYSALSSSILSSTNFNPFNGTVNLTSPTNKFTGSFYNQNGYSSDFYDVAVRNDLTVTKRITGNITGSVYDTNFSKFTKVYIQQELTASDCNFSVVKIGSGGVGSINDTIIGNTGPEAITGTTIDGTVITAQTKFLGRLTGSVYDTNVSTFNKVTALQLTASNANLIKVKIDDGSINDTVIGNTGPDVITGTVITGTVITAQTRFLGQLTGSFSSGTTSNSKVSGSFSGSYRGAIISKNTIATGSFSGSHYGSLLSKNTKATGSFSGSYRGAIISKNTIATGSFSGSYRGAIISKNTIATGSFSGSYRGAIISKNTKATGSFTGSFKGNLIGSFTNALTSSYLLQTNANTTNGVGFFDGTRLISSDALTFNDPASGYKILNISSSLSFNYLNIAGRGRTFGPNAKYNQAGIELFNLNSSEAYPNRDGWTIFSNKSGSLTFSTPIGSYEISNSGVVARSSPATEVIAYGMVQRRNGFYFWPYMVNNTTARDGAIGIGVQPPEEPTGSFDKYLRAKLQINMFSGSSEGPWSPGPSPTVEHRSTAILVNYGSGSANTGFTKTFFVSGSGNTYIHGKLNVNKGVTGSFRGIDNITNFRGSGKNVSFNGTASYAVYSSNTDAVLNGLPVAGTQYQVLAKNSGTNYDAIWTNPITSSQVTAAAVDEIVLWGNFPQREITSRNNFRFNYSLQSYICDVLFRANKITSDNGITVTNGAFTGSFVGNSAEVDVPTGPGPTQYVNIYGHNISTTKLKLSASAYCTMSLMEGQTTSVLVQNNASFTVLKWSGSLDGGTTANTKVYWSANGGGSPPTYTPTITSGNGKKDLITFVNVDNKIIGTIVQDFR